MTMSDLRTNYADFTRALIEEHRANRGRILSGPFKDRPVLLLHTIGARTGEPRIAPLVFSRTGTATSSSRPRAARRPIPPGTRTSSPTPR